MASRSSRWRSARRRVRRRRRWRRPRRRGRGPSRPAKPYRSATARISMPSVTTTPSKPSSSRSSPVRMRRLSVAGRSRVERGHQQVAGHHRLHPGGDGGAERGQLAGVQPVPVGGDPGQVVVGVDAGVAVPGEVLGAGGDAGGLEPADPGGGVPGDQRRVGAEGADADHRVVGVGVDVGVRGVVEGDPRARPARRRGPGRPPRSAPGRRPRRGRSCRAGSCRAPTRAG